MPLFLPIYTILVLIMCSQVCLSFQDEKIDATRKRHIIESYTQSHEFNGRSRPVQNAGDNKERWRTERRKRQSEYSNSYSDMLEAYTSARTAPVSFQKSYNDSYNNKGINSNYQPSNATEKSAKYKNGIHNSDKYKSNTPYNQEQKSTFEDASKNGNEVVNYSREREPLEDNYFSRRPIHPHFYRKKNKDFRIMRNRHIGYHYFHRLRRSSGDAKKVSKRYLVEEDSNYYNIRYNKHSDDLSTTSQPKHYEINIESEEKKDSEEVETYLNGQQRTEEYSFLDNGVYLIYTIQGFQLSLTLPLQKMVEDYSGGNALQVCLLSNARLIAGWSLEKYLIALLNILDLDEGFESKSSLKLLLVKFREFEKDMADVMKELVDYNSEEYGNEPHQFLSYASALVVEGIEQIDIRIVN